MNWRETKLFLEKLGINNLPNDWQTGIDLRRADLRRAYLRRADLSGADLRRADLSGADLRRADLSRADLSGADLRDAYLRDADLRRADLSGADLSGADLRRAILPVRSKWIVTWQTDGVVNIGCKSKTTDEWDAWFASDEMFETKRGTADFERIEAEYQHAKRMIEIYQNYEMDTSNDERL